MTRFRSGLAVESAGAAARPGGYPFRGSGIWARTIPFAAIAVVAEGSLALPPGPRSAWSAAVSVGLLAASAALFLLPWQRLLEWLGALAPLTYTGSVLALILAAGSASGVGIVILVPLLWTVLFQSRRESGVVVVAIVAVELVISVTPVVEPSAVIARRLVLWATLSTVIAVATHGLRDRIARSQDETARLEDHVRQLTILADRERIAAGFQQTVVQRLFAAGLDLQGAAAQIAEPDARHRVESVVTELDHTIRAVRDSIFAVERRTPDSGVREAITGLFAELGLATELRFSGPIDESLRPAMRTGLLDTLREAVTIIRPHFSVSRVDVTARPDCLVTVIDATLIDGVQSGWGSHDAECLRHSAALAEGIGLDIQTTTAAARFAWLIPLSS